MINYNTRLCYEHCKINRRLNSSTKSVTVKKKNLHEGLVSSVISVFPFLRSKAAARLCAVSLSVYLILPLNQS